MHIFVPAILAIAVLSVTAFVIVSFVRGWLAGAAAGSALSIGGWLVLIAVNGARFASCRDCPSVVSSDAGRITDVWLAAVMGGVGTLLTLIGIWSSALGRRQDT
jgi:hypothetical protein